MGLVPARAAARSLLGGARCAGRSPERVARSGVALVPEGRRIYADLTVEENLRLGFAGRRTREGVDDDVAWVTSFPDRRRVQRAGPRARSPAASSSSSRSPAPSSRGPTCCSSTSRRSASRRTSSTPSSRRSRQIRERGVTVLLVEQRPSAPSRSPTAPTCSRTASSRLTLAPEGRRRHRAADRRVPLGARSVADAPTLQTLIDASRSAPSTR